MLFFIVNCPWLQSKNCGRVPLVLLLLLYDDHDIILYIYNIANGLCTEQSMARTFTCLTLDLQGYKSVLYQFISVRY